MDMNKTTRNTILSRLKKAPAWKTPIRPEMPPLEDLAMSQEELVSKFTQNITEQTGVVHRVNGEKELLETLEGLLKEEGVSSLMASEDDVIGSLNLKEWGEKRGVKVCFPFDFNGCDLYKDFVFKEAGAGITGADFAVSESGTLVIAHNKVSARLVSLAPILHIAVVPMERLVPVYERAVEHITAQGSLPSQVTFITGPSMTADIQATPFKGMHGPKRLVVFLVCG